MGRFRQCSRPGRGWPESRRSGPAGDSLLDRKRRPGGVAAAGPCRTGAERKRPGAGISGQRLVVEEILKELRALADPAAVAGMARFGIRSRNVLGVSVPRQRALARRIGRNQQMAEALWHTGIMEARTVASLIGEPSAVTQE